MTYHPIDKPTEPGWYWCKQPSGRFDALQVMHGNHVVAGAFTLVFISPDQSMIEVSNLDGWYGPAIEPPSPEVKVTYCKTPAELRKALGDDVPRRFRWRERIKSRGMNDKVTGVGVCWRRGNELLYECWPGEARPENAPPQVEITEWLDPEPEKPKVDAWQTLFDAVGRRRPVTLDEVEAAISILREKVPLD